MSETHERLDEWFERNGIDPEELLADEKANLAFTYLRALTDRVETLERRIETLVEEAHNTTAREAIMRMEDDDD